MYTTTHYAGSHQKLLLAEYIASEEEEDLASVHRNRHASPHTNNNNDDRHISNSHHYNEGSRRSDSSRQRRRRSSASSRHRRRRRSSGGKSDRSYKSRERHISYPYRQYQQRHLYSDSHTNHETEQNEPLYHYQRRLESSSGRDRYHSSDRGHRNQYEDHHLHHNINNNNNDSNDTSRPEPTYHEYRKSWISNAELLAKQYRHRLQRDRETAREPRDSARARVAEEYQPTSRTTFDENSAVSMSRERQISIVKITPSYESRIASRYSTYNGHHTSPQYTPSLYGVVNRSPASPARVGSPPVTYQTGYVPRTLPCDRQTDSLRPTRVAKPLDYNTSRQLASISTRRLPTSPSPPLRTTVTASTYGSRSLGNNVTTAADFRLKDLTSDFKSTRIHNGRRQTYASEHSDDIENEDLSSLSNNSLKDCNNSNSSSYTSLIPQIKRRKGIVGLRNLGNTCFMNSILQCMSNVKHLHEYVFSGEYREELQSKSKQKGALMKVYAKLIDNMWNTSDNYISPDQFKSQIGSNAPMFTGYRQHDSQEFLIYLLDGLHNDINKGHSRKMQSKEEECIEDKLPANAKSVSVWKRYLQRDNSKIIDIFVGQLRSTLHCETCGHESHTFDPFMNLSLPINGKYPTTLKECLATFTKEELLDGNERPKCANCKQRRRCTKRLKIQKLPRVLIIHLKRFDEYSTFSRKLDTKVTYPITDFDLSPYLTDINTSPCTYNLFAISCHCGTTYSGHYTAHTRHPYNGTWHTFNDTSALTSGDFYKNTPEAYVLFYELNEHDL